MNKSKIAIHYDVDLDGITSGTIITQTLERAFKIKSDSFINQGKQHGLNGTDLSRFDNYDLIIVCDSLDSDNNSYNALVNSGKDIIVLDHHDINKNIDYSMITLVSSQNDYPNKALSGAGVCWKFACHISSVLCDLCYDSEIAKNLVDLAMAGLIGDMSDVSENSMENRAICNLGIESLNNPALKKICGSFGFNCKSVSYNIAPLINSANRINRNEFAKDIFNLTDSKEINKAIRELKQCKEIQNKEVSDVYGSLKKDYSNSNLILVNINSEFDISGLIANKLVGEYNKPAIVLRTLKDGIWYGSGRAVGVKDFRTMCENTKLCKAIGHPSAFGIQIHEQNLKEFINEIEYQLSNYVFDETTYIDLELRACDVTTTLVNAIKNMDRISGEGFPSITVCVRNIEDYSVSSMSDGKHLVLKPNKNLDVIQWNFKGDINYVEDCSIMSIPITVYGNLDNGYFGKRFSNKIIVSELEIKP